MIRERGLSLTELLIALVVGLFLMTATFSVLEMSSSSVQSTGQLNQLQETARLALRMMEEDIAQTGFFSDLTGVDLITGANAVAPATITGADCVGGGLNNGSFPNGIGNFRTLWAARKVSGSLISCELSTQGDSDVLQLKRLEGTEVARCALCRSLLRDSQYQRDSFFRRRRAPARVARWSDLRVSAPRLLRRLTMDLGEPALFRHSLTRGSLMEEAEMLAEGVEALQFEFGLDSNGDGSVDAYLTSTDVTDAMWDQRERAEILAVRLHLLLRAQTQDNSYSAGGTRTYQMPGGDMSFADDGYRRKRVSTTIMVQNPWLTTRRTDK
jgi:type IV pilus assembly protein PilW